MSQNEIAFLLVFTSLLVAFPPILYAENKFGATIRAWLPDQDEREHFIMGAGFTAVMMAAIATVLVFFESTRSISGVLFLAAVITLGIALATAQADEHRLAHLLIHGVYTTAYFLAGVALLYAYGFDFSVDTPWVLTAVLSSLVVGAIAGGLMTTTDPDEYAKLQNALLAFVGLWTIGFGIYMMTVNMAVGLLIVGIVVMISGIVQYKIDDPWAIITLPIGAILIVMSATGFFISHM